MKKDPYAPLRELSGAPSHWRSLEHKVGDESVVSTYDVEFPSGAPTSGVSRRDALKLSGASIAFGMLSACVARRPEEGILPYVKQPENVIPGVRLMYATAMQRSAGAIGLLVEAHEGRPTKIEGNPKHPSTLGSSDGWAQAEIMRLYDPDRARSPLKAGQATTWDDWDTTARALAAQLATSGGKGLAVLAESMTGPTSERLLTLLATKLPEAKVYRHDRLAPEQAMAGAELAFGPGVRAHFELGAVKTIFALDSDFLFSGPDHLRHAKAFGRSRAVKAAADAADMKRLYVAEGVFSGTGTNADHRLRWASGQARELIEALAEVLVQKHGVTLAPEVAAAVAGKKVADTAAKFVDVLAKELAANRGRALVMVGENQPAAVHALALAINVALGALESSALTLTTGAPLSGLGLEALTAQLNAGAVDTLLVLDANPVYTAGGALDFAAALGKAKTVVHVGVMPDETAAKAGWHLPGAHFLESWGDAQAYSGVASIIQPIILPIHGARAGISVLAQLLGEINTTDKALVEGTWRAEGQPLADLKAWRRALHEGVVDGGRPVVAVVELGGARIAEALGKVEVKAPSQDALEVVVMHGHLKDGRLSNVSWLMELPDSMSKLCWDNAVLMAPSLANTLGIKSAVVRNAYTADLVELTVDGRKITAPVFVMPGLAPYTLAINDGYGRAVGGVAQGVGVDPNPLRAGGSVVTGVSLRKTGGTVSLCSTQDHFAVPGNPLKELTFAQMSAAKDGQDRALNLATRPLFRSGTAAEYAQDGGEKIARKGDMPVNLQEKGQKHKHRPSKPIQPHSEISYEGQQWGMVIDLSACTGCNACAVACVAENNIPVVGREQVMLGREMHWIRVDRYYAGDIDQPLAAHQPVACMQCENAPCEPVCPVAATVHDEEGINSMAYNRCIGTRYCANNCPYKVRRFNYLDYTHTGDVYVEPMWAQRMKTLKLQRNPDVTVRYRGVMEKCTYCTQRVEEAKVLAKRDGKDRKALPDGAVVPACAQACPTDAITFGNINDEQSRVHALKLNPRNYEMLQELNVRPRTTYLARIRNENEELA
jgi:MoCo/4Fe-4S cofactor protein with predicted Tat translocation signal